MNHGLGRLLVALAFLPASQVCQAGYVATVSVDASARSVINLAPFVQVVDAPGRRETSSTTPGGLNDAQAASADYRSALYNLAGTSSALAQAAPGVLRIQAAAQGSSNITPPSPGTTRAFLTGAASADAQARMTDTVVWRHSTVASGLAYLDIKIRFDGVASVSQNNVFGWSEGYADYQWGFSMPWGGTASGLRAYSIDSSGVVRDSTQFGSFITTVPVFLGVAVDLSMWASATSRAAGYAQCDNCSWVVNGAAAALGDYSHTFAWEGVQAARWADGTAIDLGALSGIGASGFDYAGAAGQVGQVPEPSRVAALLLGLGWLGLRYRRRGAAG